MALQSNPYILWQLIPGLVLLWIGLYIQSRPIKKRESRIFSIMMFAGALWALASAIQLITPNNDWQRTWNSITYIGILIVPTAWFLLAVKITGLSLDRVQRIEKWLWTVPILTFLFVLTNDFHKLFFTDQTVETIAGFALLENTFGPLFYFHTVFSYILIFAGTIILSFSAIRNFPQYGTRAYGILVGVFTPLVMNATYLFGDIPQGFPDPTPIAFSVSGIAFAWAIIGGRMLEIVPLAHDVIVQNLSTGVLVLDSEQGILNINPTAVEILGLAEQRDQLGTLSELVNRIPTFEPLSAAIGGQYDLNEPLEIIIPETGKTFDVTVTSVGDNDKKLTGWLVQFNDISQRVVAEANLVNTQETFETILDTLHDSYFEADPNGVITYVNQSLVSALGYPSRATVVGKHFRNFIHRKSIQDIYESFQKLYEDKLPQESVEYYFTKKDGEERIAEIAVSPVFDGTEIIGSRGIIRDITERHRQAARMATLYQVGLATTSTLDMDAVLVTIYEQCRQVMSADVFYVALIDEKNEEIAYPLFFDNGHRLNPFRLSRDTGFAGWIIQNQVPYLINNLEVEKDQLPVKMYHTGGQQIRSYIGVPLMQRDGAIGVLSAQSYQADVYKDEDVQLLSTLAAHAATAIKNAQLYEAEQKARERLESQNREILEQRDLLNSLLHYAPLAIVNLNLDSKISAVNPAFEKLFGYAQNEIVGLDIDDILSTPEIVEEMRALTEKGLQERTYSIASRKKKDGNLSNVEIFSEPFYVAGEKCGILIFYNDITERRKIETDLEETQTTFTAVLDTLRDPYFEADSSGVITYVNNAYWRTLGYSSKEDVIGKNFRHFTERTSVRKVFTRFQALYKTNKPIEPFDYHYRRKDGSVLVADIVASPMLEDGQVIGTRGIIRDISIRIRAEEVLREAKEAAEHRAGELAAINRVANIVNRSLNLDEILQSICVEFTRIFPARNTGIALLDEKGTSLEVIAFYAVDPEEQSTLGLILDLEGNTASQEVLRTRSTVVIQDAQTDPRTKPIHELSRKRGSRSFMIVPLSSRGQVIGTIGMPAKDPEYVFKENEIELAETIASQIAAAIENARLYGQTEMALEVAERDLEIGSEIQSGFFPDVLPEIPGWEISAHFQAAGQVAGDFYDIFQFRDTNFTAFIIADVCDKGVGAALFMVLFRSLLRAFSETNIDERNVSVRLKEIVLNTNNFIAEYHGHSNMFATMFYGILDPNQNNLYYVNGGHEPPIIMNKDGDIIRRLMPTGPAVGMFPDMNFEVAQIQLEEGDILLGFTDGATDAKNSNGDLFTEERLLGSIQAPWTSIFSMVFELYTELRNHIGGQDQYDDITLISFRRKLNKDADYHAIGRVAKLDYLGELRDFVEAAAVNCGLDSESVFTFKLVTEEMCTNIIQYGFVGQEPGFITMAFEKEEGKATLSIWDDGIYFSPDQVDTPDIGANWESRQIGGLGIYLVKELVDNVTYNSDENNNNVLILEKFLSPDKQMED